MSLVSPKHTQHYSGVLVKDRGRRPKKKMTKVPADPPVWLRHIHYWSVTRWKCKHIYIMTASKPLDQPRILTHAHLEIAIVRSILMEVNEPKPIKLQQHHKLLKGLFISKTDLPIAYPCHQPQQSALEIQFFQTVYVRQICLFANTARVKGTSTAATIPAFSPSSASRFTMLARTIPSLQFIPIHPHLPSVERGQHRKCCIVLDLLENRELQWCLNRSIIMMTEISSS